jgi:hypothetical protein
MAANLNKKIFIIHHLYVLKYLQILLGIQTLFFGLITKFIKIRDELVYDEINRS